MKTNKDERKSPEEIKLKILEALNEKPLNALEISKAICSNWSTVKNYVEELVKINGLREINLGNQTVYQKITEDTYFNIPLKKEQREMFRYIFSKVIQEYKKSKNKQPSKTELAKIVVEVIDKAKLSNLPTVWYLYGKIPLMVVDPLRDYSTNYVPENREKAQIDKIIIEIVASKKGLYVRETKIEQYNRYNNQFYLIKEELFEKITKTKNNAAIIALLNKFYVSCPILEDFPYIADYTYKTYFFACNLDNLGVFDKHIPELIVLLDNLWKLISIHLFLETFPINLTTISSKKKLISLYLEHNLEIKKMAVQESLSNLEFVYMENLKNVKIKPLSKEAAEIRKTMQDWDWRHGRNIRE